MTLVSVDAQAHPRSHPCHGEQCRIEDVHRNPDSEHIMACIEVLCKDPCPRPLALPEIRAHMIQLHIYVYTYDYMCVAIYMSMHIYICNVEARHMDR